MDGYEEVGEGQLPPPPADKPLPRYQLSAQGSNRPQKYRNSTSGRPAETNRSQQRSVEAAATKSTDDVERGRNRRRDRSKDTRDWPEPKRGASSRRETNDRTSDRPTRSMMNAPSQSKTNAKKTDDVPMYLYVVLTIGVVFLFAATGLLGYGFMHAKEAHDQALKSSAAALNATHIAPTTLADAGKGESSSTVVATTKKPVEKPAPVSSSASVELSSTGKSAMTTGTSTDGATSMETTSDFSSEEPTTEEGFPSSSTEDSDGTSQKTKKTKKTTTTTSTTTDASTTTEETTDSEVELPSTGESASNADEVSTTTIPPF